MKKIDLILAALTGEGVAILFLWLFKSLPFFLPIFKFLFPIFFPILSIFGIFVAEILGRKFLILYQLAKFLLIGAFFAVFDLILLNFLMAWFGISKEEIIKYAIFVAISFTIVTIFKYFANKFWAFEKFEKEKMEIEFGKFFLITFFSLLIQAGLATFSFKILVQNFPPILAGNLGKLFGIIGASAWNFLGYKFLVFKK